MIEELETIALVQDITEHGLVAGDAGTVVHIYDQGEGYEVEFVTADGKTIAVRSYAVELKVR